jgi:hypothetical protein
VGLDVALIELLCCAKSIGVDFSETLTIGRQTIVNHPSDFVAPLLAIGISKEMLSEIRLWDFGEPLFKLLGARQVCSLDASDYEQATYICDLNKSCSEHLRKKFSMVVDGGSLEHVFNVPQAFKNCMEMVRIGGYFVQVTNANNFMGHGFWQFSPEALYRIFSPENGFLTKVMLLREAVRGGAWHQVTDPASCGRVELVNLRPTYICTIAQRSSDQEIFSIWPQQSDYVRIWKEGYTSGDRKYKSIPAHIRRMVPESIKNIVKEAQYRFERPENIARSTFFPFRRPYYRYISARDLVRGRLALKGTT